MLFDRSSSVTVVASSADNFRRSALSGITLNVQSPVARDITVPVVSFVIPCYNGSRYLPDCLRSLETIQAIEWDAIVVDDGSTEDIESIVRQCSPRVRYVRQANHGPSAARNRGMAESTGKYIRFLDCDDVLFSASSLIRQVAVLDNHEEIGLVHGPAIKIDATGNAFTTRKPPFGSGSRMRLGIDEIGSLLFDNYITTSSVLVRRTTIEAIGGFDSAMRESEDWECWLRIAKLAAFYYIDEPVIYYRVHEASITANYVVEPWLNAHLQILNSVFAWPDVQSRYEILRPAVISHLYYRSAMLAYGSGRSSIGRCYALKALRGAVRRYEVGNVLRIVTLVGKTMIPPILRTIVVDCRRQLQLARMVLDVRREV